MPRLGSGSKASRSQGFLIGSNTETLPTTTTNVSIVSDWDAAATPTKRRSKPIRAASCVIPRVSPFADETPTLPYRAPDSKPAAATSPKRSKRSSYRAAEHGNGDVLPTESSQTTTIMSPLPSMPHRTSFRASERGRGQLLPTRSGELLPLQASSPSAGLSNNSYHQDGSSFTNRLRCNSTSNVNPSRYTDRCNTTGTEQLQAMTHSLRNRRSNVQLDEEFNVPIVEDTPASYMHNGGGNNSNSGSSRDRGIKHTWSDTFGKQGGKVFRRTCSSADAGLGLALLNMNRIRLFQACAMLLVTFFVWDSYYKAMTATEQLLSVKHDESMMMLHLKRLEEQSLHLHESISRLAENGPSRAAAGHGGHDNSDSVDEDLIKVQYGQLRQMEDELTHEVKALQNKMQQTDRSSIVHAYGEGPIQVGLEIEFPGAKYTGSSRISILLWYETPHAAWTLLHQIDRGLWDGATFSLDKNLAIVAEQLAPDKEKRLDFVEKGQKQHEAWTVGLTESDSGALGLFINLQDNTHYHAHDACIGKVIDGFDTLQRLTRTARDPSTGGVLRVKKASGSHLTRRDSAGLM